MQLADHIAIQVAAAFPKRHLTASHPRQELTLILLCQLQLHELPARAVSRLHLPAWGVCTFSLCVHHLPPN